MSSEALKAADESTGRSVHHDQQNNDHSSNPHLEKEEPQTRQELSFFQQRKKQWDSRPRVQLVALAGPLPPLNQYEMANARKGNETNLGPPATSSVSISSEPAKSSSTSSIVKEESSSGIRKYDTKPTQKRDSSDCAHDSIQEPTLDECSEKEEESCSFKSRLTEFYQMYNPSKLSSIASALETFKGREEEMFEKLRRKYCSNLAVPEGDGPRCFLDISVGDKHIGKIVIKLYTDKCPLAANNFYSLCTNGTGNLARDGKPLHYKQSTFHRIVKGFVAQGGDFTKHNGTGGESIYRNTPHGDMWGKFKDDPAGLEMSHCRRGLLSMANSGKNTNGSQFFITFSRCTHLDGKHVVFGEVVEGWEQLNEMESVVSDGKDQPMTQNTIRIEDCGALDENPGVKDPASKAASVLQNGGTISGTPASFGGGLASSASRTNAPSTFGVATSGDKSPFSFGAPASSFVAAGESNGMKASPFSNVSGRNMLGGIQSAGESAFPFRAGATTSFTAAASPFQFKPTNAGSTRNQSSGFGF
jgi:cyclophilin family peptidyl-prolyl cis-trans isomerase